ncbi:MAG: hypothetical protein CMF98_04400 [Candidatus Marinimicrobia bacterium]|nr:hypothetical protein [Candidatus Neomarinimicrobiota bacterium]OUW50404.1 MAG: hypothetical protein CBD50_02995 [bacterium TMED190]|tara:strand:+ start:203 stop:400 length:198 start_codon:yes stop_codon:yes gene_type:complete
MDTELPFLSSLEDKVKNAIVEIKRLRANETTVSTSLNNSSNDDLKISIKKIIDLIENNEHFIGDK